MALNKAFHYWDILCIRMIEVICLIFVYCIAKGRGIEINKGNRFIGIPTFRRKEGSTIRIGNKCQFRSKSNSNLIGINRPCIVSTLTPKAIIEIGNECGFSGTVIGSFDSIKIGNNVKCGANTLITDSDWHNDDIRVGDASPIVIANNVWLGEGVKVLKGVKIGENSIIGAGSIVVKDVPANVIAAGNPCRVIKEINY